MKSVPLDPEYLVALGGFAGALVLVVLLSVIIASTYSERALLLLGVATVMGVLGVQTLVGGHPFVAEGVMLLVLAADGMQLRDLVSHAGALRAPRRWLVAISLGLLPLLAAMTTFGRWHLLLPGLAAWIVVVCVIILRAWPQSQPWARWLVPGKLSLSVAAAWLGWRSLDAEPDPAVPLAAMLCVWSAAVFLATTWRGRLFSETRLRIDARNTVDPLTGLSTPLIFYDRVRAVRSLIRRYGHPSVLLLVHIEHLDKLGAEFGPEVAESAVLVAAIRIREALRDGDVAARVSHSRIGVLAEGTSLAEGSANIASRIVVAGLKEPLPTAPTEFLQFRIVMALVPVTSEAPKSVLQKMSDCLDTQVREGGERRIVALGDEELA